MKMSYFESPLEGLLGPSIREQYSGDHLIERRKEVDLGQRGLARLMGINHENVNYWEKRRNMPTCENIVKMVMILYGELHKKYVGLREENKNLIEWVVTLQEEIDEMRAAQEGE